MSPPSQNTGDTGSQDVFIQHQASPDTDIAAAISGAPDAATRYLMVIDGKLQYCDKSGRMSPMDALPEAFKQWLENECRDREKKKEYIRWLMDAPLDVNEDVISSTSETLNVSKVPQILNEQYVAMEIIAANKEEHIKCLIEEDSTFWLVNGWAEKYTRMIQNSAQTHYPSPPESP